MSVRLVAGRAGSGKTHGCQSQIAEELRRDLINGPRLILLVPEQAALQIERSLVTRAPARALGRCEVLSFRRLAGRIFNESAGPTPVLLSATGRQMALRFLVNRHRGALREFGRVANRSGFVAELAAAIAELLQENVGLERLQAAARAAEEQRDPVSTRLHDMALLYRAYLDYLGDRRVDPDGILDLARARLPAADWLRDARIWIDGFAGLTQQQMRMIAALARVAAHIDIALLLDPGRGKARALDAPPDELSLFARTERTWAALSATLNDAGIAIEPPIRLDTPDAPRFGKAPLLGRLEQRLFAVPPRPDDADAAAPALAGRAAGSIDGASQVRLLKARDRRSEIDAALATVRDLITRPEDPLRYRDIAIVVRDLAPYHDLLSAGLAARGIPFFIDRRRPTCHHPLVQAIRALLRIRTGARFGESLIHLLKSGLGGLADESADAVENDCLAYGLSTPAAWEKPWTLPVPPAREGDADSAAFAQALAEVESARAAIRTRLGEWWPDAQDGPASCRRWADQLYGALRRLGITEALANWCDEAHDQGDLDEAAEHQQVWAGFVALLDEVVAALGEEPMAPAQFREVLEAALSDFTLGLAPATLDQVLVGSIERSRHPPVRAVFLLGFCDGQFPARVGEEAIFGDAERAFLDAPGAPFGRTRRQQLLDERLLAYIAVTRPSEFLWISVPESDEEGRALLPSPYWPALRAALPEVPVETIAEDDPAAPSSPGQLAATLAVHLRDWATAGMEDPQAAPWLALYDWARCEKRPAIREVLSRALAAFVPCPEATLSERAAAALWPPPHRTSVTRLESFARCPFRHYAAYGLNLAERRTHELTSLDWGRLYHAILDRFVSDLVESDARLGDLSTDEIARRVGALCEQVLPHAAEHLNLDEGQRKIVRWRTRRELPAAVEGIRAALGQTHLSPRMTEKRFGDGRRDELPAIELHTAGGRTVLVRGKIDRVDLLATRDRTLAVIFDYKRSLRDPLSLRLDEVYHGLALQLLAYLIVIRDHPTEPGGPGILPGGAFYLPLVSGYRRVAHPDEADGDGFNPFDAFRPRGIVDFDWIDTIDPSMAAGRSAAFNVARRKDGQISHFENSDAVGSGALPQLLEHVRRKMAELADTWIAGDIGARPARLRGGLPCESCPYRSVCRFEYASGRIRKLSTMPRNEVLATLADTETDGNG